MGGPKPLVRGLKTLACQKPRITVENRKGILVNIELSSARNWTFGFLLLETSWNFHPASLLDFRPDPPVRFSCWSVPKKGVSLLGVGLIDWWKLQQNWGRWTWKTLDFCYTCCFEMLNLKTWTFKTHTSRMCYIWQHHNITSHNSNSPISTRLYS